MEKEIRPEEDKVGPIPRYYHEAERPHGTRKQAVVCGVACDVYSAGWLCGRVPVV